MADIKTLADYEDQIDIWQEDGEIGVSLPKYLGLTWDQYRTLVESGKVDLDDDGVYEFTLRFEEPVPGQRTRTAGFGIITIEACDG